MLRTATAILLASSFIPLAWGQADTSTEEEEARQHYERGEKEFKRIGAARRLTESNYRSPS